MQTELRYLLRVFREQLAWWVVKFLFLHGSKPGRHFARNLREFGVARSEELKVNQWIVQDIHWLSSQSERAKNTIHCFLYILNNNNIIAPIFQFLGIFHCIKHFWSVRFRFQKCPLSVLERCPSYREYSYNKMTEKRKWPTPGVRLIEVSVKRELN